MKILLHSQDFDPWQEIQNYQAVLQLTGKYGATSIFIGTMRDFNDGDEVVGMTLEHYPGMTEKQLTHIVNDALKQWPILEALVVHRVGDILPNDTIVLVAVWSSHRGDAYDANRFIMEALKSKAPFWKKERLYSNQQRWVDKNTDGYLSSQP